MNILFIFHCPIIASNGGVERVTSILCREFEKRGHSVFYLATENADNKEGLSNSPRQIFLNVDLNNPKPQIEKFRALLAHHKIDIIINQQITDASRILLEHAPERIKKITCHHVQPFPYGGKERIIKLKSYPSDLPRKIFKWISVVFPYFFKTRSLNAEREWLRQAASVSDKVVLLSDKFKPRVMKYYPKFPYKKLWAINNPNTFDSYPDLEKKEKLILFVGRLVDPQKNIKDFIDVWDLFQRKNPDWKAMIVGDSPKRKIYEEYARKKQVNNLSFEGQQTNVDEYYKRATFVCLTSIYEGWGMVLTEGMANGCIPVCFNSYESASDIIDDGENGIIAKAFNKEEMAGKMSGLVRQPSQMKRMAENAQEKVKQFSVEKIAMQWESLFNSIVK